MRHHIVKAVVVLCLIAAPMVGASFSHPESIDWAMLRSAVLFQPSADVLATDDAYQFAEWQSRFSRVTRHFRRDFVLQVREDSPSTIICTPISQCGSPPRGPTLCEMQQMQTAWSTISARTDVRVVVDVKWLSDSR